MAIVLSLATGALFSWGKLAYHCRRPISEACVWGRAYNAVAFPLETLLIGAVVFAAWAVVQRSFRR